MGTTIVWLNEKLAASDGDLIGPKAASLCTLYRLGVKIPPCFFLTIAAFREHLEADGLRPRIVSLVDTLNTRTDGTHATLEQIRQTILHEPLHESLQGQIAVACTRLGPPIVAVRSSATAEDLPGHSFAGQDETILAARLLGPS